MTDPCTPPGQILGGEPGVAWGQMIFSLNKKKLFGGFSGGTGGCLGGNYFFVSLKKKMCLGDFQGELIFVSPPDHGDFGGFPGRELISVHPPQHKNWCSGDLDYSSRQFLLARGI